MGRIGDLIPSLYFEDRNDLQAYIEALEPESDFLEQQVREIADLQNVDRCPERYLPYIAALTNCPLIGDDPRLWRRQIRNWPWVLKIKGTERSLDVFLNSIGAKEFKVTTWFRDALGNYTEEKPAGAPVYNEADKLWYNIRTHYFSLDIVLGTEFVSLYKWSVGEIVDRIKPWLVRAKPFHAELLDISVIPPDLSDPDHGCLHDVCSWAHGILPTVPIGMEEFRIPFAPRIAAGQTNVVTVAGVYERLPRFDMYVFGHPMPETGQRNSSLVSRSVAVDRRFFGIWRGWHKRRRWSHGGTWGDHNAPGKIGVEGGLLSTFVKSAAVWGHASFDGLAAMKPRTWNVPDAGRLDENIYADRDGGGAEWMSIDEYGIRQEQKTTDIAGIWRNAEILRGERNVRSAAEAEGLRHEQTGGSALCLSGRILYTARERWWDNEPWDAGTWERSVRQYILSRFANATVTTITKEVEP